MYVLAVTGLVQHIGNLSPVRAREPGGRIKSQPRCQNERPLPRTRMRQSHIRVLADEAIDIDDVKIQCARRPMLFPRASMSNFDMLQAAKQTRRVQLGRDLDDSVEKIRGTIRHAPCGGAVQRRYPSHLCAFKAVDIRDRGPHRRRDVALVAAECDHGVVHGRDTAFISSTSFAVRIPSAPPSLDGDAHVGERHGDRSFGLMHGDGYALDCGMVGYHGVSDESRQPLNQVDMLAFDDGYDPFGDAPVINRVMQVIAGTGT